jgi:hypothetical protein
VDVDEEQLVRGKKEGKMRGVSDSKLAQRLRHELAELLAAPLRPRMNSKFFTGGSSQAVAAAVSKGDADTSAPASIKAMQQSLENATEIVARKHGACALALKQPTAEQQPGKAKAKRTKSLAEHQAAALQRALQTKQMKKHGKALRRKAAVVPEQAAGSTALQALLAAGASEQEAQR